MASISTCKLFQFLYSLKLTQTFPLSSFSIARLVRKYPILLDAIVSVAQRRGSEFLSYYCAAMDGSIPKTWFLRPEIGAMIVLEGIRLWIKKKIDFKGESNGN